MISDKDNMIVSEVSKKITDDEQSKIYNSRFTADDVACGWITALRQYVGDGKISDKLARLIQERAAELTAAYGLARQRIQTKGVEYDEVN